MKIKKIQGFKQITPFMVSQDQNPLETIKNCGIDMYSNVNYQSKYSIGVGSMSVLGNTFSGLKLTTPAASSCPVMALKILDNVDSLKDKALQVGFRLTQQGTAFKASMFAVSHMNTHTPAPTATTTRDDSSAYYEVLVYFKGSYAYFSVFVNKIKIFDSSALPCNSGNPVYLDFGSNTIRPAGEDSFTFYVGDIYIAEVDYNADKTVTAEPLGAITIEPFKVTTYAGDKHTNTKGVDIVTALNTVDTNNDMGVLSLKPVEQPATLTFTQPDIAGKKILGIGVNFVYKDSIAPNNRISYQITEGTTQLPEEMITDRNNDVTGYTTYTRLLTAPANGGDWNAENLKFKLDMVNKGSEE
ncbi:hypothetical protein LVO39_000980 [Salmonella enterica]|nr:hypothetical protein [Salmonella enterica subsp. enterica serovar Florida]EIQ6924833.1 hypothetical protein [Salmonella enterica]ECF4164736.1 hypothetical protein [Salmonella enterica subsp. enterica serovar Florida]ECW2472569.1 hypothetical protein [Salmonella enterica subsp. enterica serovar Florida]EJS1429894.1 hypothetical protein [Salmonella enterica]